jgi:predicted small secreted protein
MKNLFLLAVMALFVTSLVGCETTKGAGQDIENTGKNIQQGVDRNR